MAEQQPEDAHRDLRGPDQRGQEHRAAAGWPSPRISWIMRTMAPVNTKPPLESVMDSSRNARERTSDGTPLAAALG